jgi:cytoskeletal protein RodZ
MKRKKKTEDFLHQERSAYNRSSGKKTLFLVGILIFFVVVLSITTILMLRY